MSPRPCRHSRVETYRDGSGGVVLWGCASCKIRFYPHDAAERSSAGQDAAIGSLIRQVSEALPAGWLFKLRGPYARAEVRWWLRIEDTIGRLKASAEGPDISAALSGLLAALRSGGA